MPNNFVRHRRAPSWQDILNHAASWQCALEALASLHRSAEQLKLRHL